MCIRDRSDGTWNPATGKVIFVGGEKYVYGGNNSFYDLEININSGRVMLIYDTAYITHNLYLTSGSLRNDYGTGYFEVQGDIILGANFGEYNSYGGLKIAGSANQSLDASSGGKVPGFELDKTGGVLTIIPETSTKEIIFNGGSYTFTSSPSTIDFLTNQTKVIFTRGEKNFYGNGVSFYDVEINLDPNFNLLFGISGNATVTHNLYLTQGKLNTSTNGTLYAEGDIVLGENFGAEGSTHDGSLIISGSNNQTISGSGILPWTTINKTGGTLTFANDVTINERLTYQAGNVNFGTTKIKIIGYTSYLNGNGIQLYDLEIDKINNSFPLNINGITIVQNNLILTEGGIDAGTDGDLQVQGDIVCASTFGTADTKNDGLITLTGSNSQTITYNTGCILPKVTINKTNSTDIVTFSGTGPIQIHEDFTISKGIVNINGLDLTLDSTSLYSCSNNGTLRLEGGETVTFNEASGFDEDSGTVEFVGTGIYSGLPDGFGDTFYNLTFNGTGEWQLDNNLAIDGALTITQGTLNLNGYNLQDGPGVSSPTLVDISGTLKLKGTESLFWTTNDTDSGTYIYLGDGDSLSDTFTIKDFGSEDYYNLIINSSDGSTDIFQLGDNLVIKGNLTITSGNLDITNSNYQINIQGDWSNLDTFTPHQGTVIFDGQDQTISGFCTFYNLTKIDTNNDSTDLTLTFQASQTQTINGLLTLQGLDDDDRINLRSSNPGTRWNLIANGTFSIDWVDVQDSDASGGNTISHTNTLNSGNNLKWGFPSYLKITAPNSTITAGNSLQITVSAYDIGDYLATSYSGTKNLTFSGLSSAPDAVSYTHLTLPTN